MEYPKWPPTRAVSVVNPNHGAFLLTKGQMKISVIFYRDWYDIINDLPTEERLEVYEAIMRYAFDGLEPQDRYIKAVTRSMFVAINRDGNRYEERCERNRRNAMNRWRNRLDANDANASDGKHSVQSHTTATYNENEKENGNENEPPTNVVGEKEKEKVSTDTPKKKSFVKPSVEQVAAYCKERENYVNAEDFVNFYESKGWVVGKAPMKDWKAAVRTWEQKDGRKRKGVTLGVGEWIDAQGERKYGTGHTAPMSAPPRPSEDCYWSAESNNWVAGV